MAGLSKEEIIMSSNDNSITLTTHRILQKSTQVHKEMMLKDILAHEIIKKRSNYYKILSLFFGVLTIFLFILYFTKSSPFDLAGKTEILVMLIVPLILATISIFLLLSSHVKYLKISGRFNDIEFSLKNLSEQSLNKFLSRLIIESDNRKREE